MEKLSNLEGFSFNKKFGQNFIFDTNLLNSIVSRANITKSDDVLEIGVGAATLTKSIASFANKVVSYEIDTNLTDIITNNLKDVDNAKVIYKDALKASIEEIDGNFAGDYCVVANLPYYITTPLIFKFLQQTKKVKKIVVMVQKEVAERIISTEKDKDYGVTSVMVAFYGNAKIQRIVNRKMFVPAPNVDSAILEIEIVKNKFDCNEELFSKIVHASFSMRRKTILNNLAGTFNISKQQIVETLNSINISETNRAEKLSVNDYVSMTNAFSTILS